MQAHQLSAAPEPLLALGSWCSGIHRVACRAVLVGDPQQLPATVLSKAARAGQLERSLFERLQRSGHPCTMLSVQYRMHAAIRAFPSAFFYQDRLQDACATCCTADSPASCQALNRRCAEHGIPHACCRTRLLQHGKHRLQDMRKSSPCYCPCASALHLAM